ncbi:Putative aldehyde dehydrogenase [Mycobacterium talmoniae]|uniref:Aldehyde dehydrogenase n=1 Tax=Mycobacterium talmoniae TaxID=1858794 RepID=A0A2S8BRG3_9MYCO|nr:Putative aldehyde dehydrogenase [Mycobacterium talmoniae]
MALLADRGSDLLIDGKMVSGSAGTFGTINPATEEVLGTAANADAADMDRAIEAARRAFDDTDWSRNTGLRVRCVRQLRDVLREHVEELRELTIAEVGAPRMLTASAQLEGPIDDLGFAADTAESYPWNQDLGEASPMGIATRRTIAREAVGVVGAITPWNFPHQINLAKLGPALAAGNTVVLKPAPDTPWCAAAVGQLIAEHTDIPPGVVNVVTSDDHSVGALLAKDPRVDMISFTGSTATGRSVSIDAAGTIKRVFLELGGKSAFVVLDDADLAGAASMSAFTACMHAGQGCAVTTRLVVPRARYDEAVAAAAATMGSIKPGDPTDPGTVCGPLISARQRDRVQSYLDLAVREGGTFACGGGRPADRDTGFFIEPTVTRRAGQRRPGGPGGDLRPGAHRHRPRRRRRRGAHRQRLAVWPVGHRVWRRPGPRAAVAARLRVGTVNVNGGVWYSADAPFGGYKQSGNGREMGVAGFEEYLETKVIAEAI